MSEPTLLRMLETSGEKVPPTKDSRWYSGWMVPVEPNLRLCFTHNTFEWGTDKGEPCWEAEMFTDPSPCQWFAAAEIPEGEQREQISERD